MPIKSLIPSSFKKAYNKYSWFLKNYDHIDNYSKTNAAFIYGPVSYAADGLATCNNADFRKDPQFSKAYQAAAATNPWPGFNLEWRVYIVCWFANHVKNLPGDFVECGVNTGAYAKAIVSFLDFNRLNKTFYLLDTFDGLVPELVSDAERTAGLESYMSQYKNVYDSVVENFKNDKVKIIKGAVPGTLPLCTTDSIAYLSIDMNSVQPEVAALEYFYQKVVPGGVIMLDDYGFPQHIHQKNAHDQFAKSKGESILTLPTGQGVIIKK